MRTYRDAPARRNFRRNRSRGSGVKSRIPDTQGGFTMRIPFALAATMAALALAPAAALAASDGPPLTESTSNGAEYPGGLACTPPIDENALPHQIGEPSVPGGPGEP